MPLCASCGPATGKLVQHKSGLCRTCDTREHGYVGTADREAARLAELALERGLVQRRIPKPTNEDGSPIVLRTYVIRGLLHEVVWDGS